MNFGRKRFIQQAEDMNDQTKLRRYGGTTKPISRSICYCLCFASVDFVIEQSCEISKLSKPSAVKAKLGRGSSILNCTKVCKLAKLLY